MCCLSPASVRCKGKAVNTWPLATMLHVFIFGYWLLQRAPYYLYWDSSNGIALKLLLDLFSWCHVQILQTDTLRFLLIFAVGIISFSGGMSSVQESLKMISHLILGCTCIPRFSAFYLLS